VVRVHPLGLFRKNTLILSMVDRGTLYWEAVMSDQERIDAFRKECIERLAKQIEKDPGYLDELKRRMDDHNVIHLCTIEGD
jgi:hypothetical protein